MTKEDIEVTVTSDEVEAPKTPADMVLDQSKGLYNFVVVLGVNKNGGLDVNTSNNNLQNMHWILERALFKLNVYETNLEEKALREAKTKETEGMEQA